MKMIETAEDQLAHMRVSGHTEVNESEVSNENTTLLVDGSDRDDGYSVEEGKKSIGKASNK